jgi:FHA domain
MTAKPRLVAVGGPDQGREYLLDQTQITIGRHPDSTVAVEWDGSVSRHHARLTCQTGLFWLEDLGSKRGTFLTLADGEERRLPPHEATLLLDGASLRLGFNARFQVLGVVATEDETVRLLLDRLQQALNSLYAGLPYLPQEGRRQQLALLHQLEARLQAAQSEAELLRLVAEGVPTLLAVEGEGECGPEPPTPPALDALPPLPDSLPNPDNPKRLETIRNVFIGDIRARLPDATNEEEDVSE